MKSEIGRPAPSRARRRVVFDVSTLFIWDRPPVGIVRVQYELASYLVQQDDFPVAFVRFSSDRASLNPIGLDVVQQRLEEMKHAGSALAARKIAEKIAIQRMEAIKEDARTIVMPEAVKLSARARIFTKAGLKLIVPPTQRKNVRAAWNVYRAAGTAAVFKKLTRRALGYKSQASPAPELIAISPPAASPSRSLEMHVPEALNAAMTQGDFLSSEDVLVSAGLDWDHSNYELLYWMKNRLRFGFFGIFYDTIPIEHPEYANSLEFPRRFFNYFYYLNNLADRVACISDFSQSRYLSVAHRLGFRESPMLQTILMGDRIAKNFEEIDVKTRTLPRRYVLYVSSIEARKNHETLLAAWQRGIEANSAMPDLVCVGMRGWGVDDMFERYESNGRLRAKIHFLSDVDDRELAEIYRRSLFCVFPSRVEGWGLGAAEAMAYGKICIVSTAPALIEATRGMMPAIETEDIQDWHDAILHWSSNDDLREQLEERVRNEFIPKDWATYAKEVFAFALNQ